MTKGAAPTMSPPPPSACYGHVEAEGQPASLRHTDAGVGRAAEAHDVKAMPIELVVDHAFTHATAHLRGAKPLPPRRRTLHWRAGLLLCTIVGVVYTMHGRQATNTNAPAGEAGAAPRPGQQQQPEYSSSMHPESESEWAACASVSMHGSLAKICGSLSSSTGRRRSLADERGGHGHGHSAHATSQAVASILTDCVNVSLAEAETEALADGGNGTSSCSTLLWPMPKAYVAGDGASRMLSSAVTFVLEGDAKDSTILTSAIDRYLPLIFSHGVADGGSDDSNASVSEVWISLDDASDGYPTSTTDESYELLVPEDDGEVVITAATVYGAMHALEVDLQAAAQAPHHRTRPQLPLTRTRTHAPPDSLATCELLA